MIVALIMLTYAAIGVIVGRISRNRCLDKKVAQNLGDRYGYRAAMGLKPIDLERALTEAKSEMKATGDGVLAGGLGGFFWPIMVIAIFTKITFSYAIEKFDKVLPKSKSEKQVYLIKAQRQLDTDRAELIKQGKKMGLNVKPLEKL